MKKGIKETKEALIAVNEVALLLVGRFRDGLGIDDAAAIWDKLNKDEEFKGQIKTAYDGWQLIPEEIADIDLTEGLELVKIQISYVPRFLAAFKKPKA